MGRYPLLIKLISLIAAFALLIAAPSLADEAEALSFTASGEIRMGIRTQLKANREGVTWSVRNSTDADAPARASIDGNGVLRGMYAGGIVVTCEDGAEVCERQFEVSGPVLSISTDTAYVMRSVRLEASAAGFPDAVFTFALSADGASFASISGDEIRGIAPGRVYVTAATCVNGTEASVTRAIEIVAPDALDIDEEETGITLKADRTRLREGDTAHISVVLSGMPQDTPVSYAATGCVETDPYGTVTALREGSGTVTVTAVYNGLGYSSEISFTITSDRLALKGPAYAPCGGTFAVEATLPADAAAEDVKWIYDGKALEMTAPGQFRTLRAGETRIAASSADADGTVDGSLTVKVYSPQVVYTGAAKLRTGESAELTAGVPGLGQDETDFIWTIEDGDGVIALDGGTVLAHGEGTARLLCTASSAAFAGTLTCAFEITVEDGRELACAITGPDGILSGETGEYGFTVWDEKGPVDATDVMWTIAGEALAEVDGSGRVTPLTKDGVFLGGGAAYITIRAQGNGISCEKDILIVQQALSLTPLTERVSLPVGKSEKLEYSVTPEDCAERLEWTSSDPAVVDVGEDGTVRALSPGTAVVTASAAHAQARYEICVYEPAEKVTIRPEVREIEVGTSVQLQAELTPAGTQDTVLTWSSSDPAVAAVDGNGCVTAYAAGSCVVTCGTEGGAKAETEISCVVYSRKVAFEGGQVDEPVYAIEENGSLEVSVCVLPLDATYDGFTAQSSDETVAAAEGCAIYALKEGTARIRYTAADGRSSAEAVVIVKKEGTPKAQAVLDRRQLDISAGSFYRLNATVDPPAASVYWYSDDPDICAVDQSGVIEGIWGGSTTVHCVTEDGTEDTCAVTVELVYPTKLRIEPGTIEMNVDDVAFPQLVPTPENAVTDGIRWQTSDPDVALVSLDGTVTAMGVGRCTVTAVSENGVRGTCTVNVTAVPVKYLYVTSPQRELLVGSECAMTCGYSPSNATNGIVYWTSSDPHILRADRETGRVTALSEGECVLTAHAKDGSGCAVSVRMRVTKGQVESFSLSVRNVTKNTAAAACGDAVNADYGDELALVCLVSPDMEVTYASSDETVAVVTRSGMIRTKGAGTCTVTACAGGLFEKSFTLRVNTENGSAYRVLVIGQYTDPGEAGYLTFSDNCVSGVSSAFLDSRVEGAKYDVVTVRNIKTAAEFTAQTKQLANTSKEGDVTVVYLLSHGTVTNGVYRWYLNGTDRNGGPYLTASQIVSALKGIKGHVVLMVTSCYSGGFANNVNVSSLTRIGDGGADRELMDMVMASDGANGTGSSMSLICSNTDRMRSSYVKTASDRSYEYFSLAVTRALGRDMSTGVKGDPQADGNGDGYVTLGEFTEFTVRETKDSIESYIAEYGGTGFVGDPGQTASGYISERARDIVLFGLY